ncbi:MAG: dihydrolipoyl dehydrogenase [Gemmatales bacterium]|nr:MAG: dihydrolipoyl dehydrogenase [Gemmatales bacterium]
MAQSKQTDLAVLGAGPGGYAAAFLAADKGMHVTLINDFSKPGGACLHVGCIPSKALLHAAKFINDVEEASRWGIQFAAPKIDLKTLRRQKETIVDNFAKNLLDLCKRRKVDYIGARGEFVASNRLRLDNGDEITFQHCIIATGSRPARLPALQLDSDRVMDSTAALELQDVPEKLLVVGGGYIGLELGTVYAALGSKVTVVELTSGLLPGVDRDLVRPLQQRLSKAFEHIYLETKVSQLKETGKGIQAVLEGEEVADKNPVFDRVLVSVGRRPNTDNLGLQNTRVEVDERGFIRVDDQRRTADERIFAIGDVAGEPMLAHKASHEGKIVAEVLAGEPAMFDVRAIPAVVFTDPEIAWCGLTETQARQEKRQVKTVRFPWAASGRAVTVGQTDGLTKLIVDPESEAVLGAGIVGSGAGELISEAVLAIEMGATARDLAMIIHPHPTLSETIGEAAETFFGTATHLMRTRK